MRVIDLNDEIDDDKLFEFCKDGLNDSKMPASENMDVDNWENKPHTLLHTLFRQRRFDRENRAGYLVVDTGKKYIAGSGFYPLEEDPNVCLISVRTYIIKTERGHLLNGYYLLPKQIELATNLNYKSVIITFNKYNLWLKDSIERANKNRSKILGKRIPESYKGWNSLNHTINIQYTKQWCLYKHIDNNYDRFFRNTMANIRSN